jgi:hypothetical protein
MNEIIKDYIHETSCKIIVNKLQKVLTYVICWQMDEMPLWQFVFMGFYGFYSLHVYHFE